MTVITRFGGIWRSWALLFLLLPSALAQDFAIGSYQVVSSNRVGRTVWDLAIRATVTNNVAPAIGVSARVTNSLPGVTILQDTLGFGDVGAPATAISSNTFLLRHDQLFPFDPSALQWAISVQSMALLVAIKNPTSGLLTNGTNVIVTGTFGPGVSNVVVNGVLAALTGSNFTANVPLREGRNIVSAVGTNAFGGAGAASVLVSRDTTPPLVNIEAPGSGVTLATRQITVAGMINDVVPGTVNPEQATVMVNGLPAMVLNRSYAINDLLLSLGHNLITVVARDRAGNETRREIEVTVQDTAAQKRLVRLAGDMQSGMIGTVLPQPLIVELVDANGIVQTNQPVTFAICRNDGLLLAPPEQGRSFTLRTDDRGQAGIAFQLGTRTGAGNNQVEVTSPGSAGQLTFCANATGAPPHRISALLPETQVGATGQPLPLPWTAYVTDVGGNPVAGAPVTFLVFQGDGGTVNGVTMLTTNSDTDGRAAVLHTLGSQEGINNNVVAAMIAGLTNTAATFTASARAAQPAQNTRVVGLVLDNANRPMSNILCRIQNNGAETVTDVQGQFAISNAPVGEVHLLVDARDRGYPGTWHALEFVLNTVAGRDNSVDRPIYMLPLGDSALAGGDQQVTLQMFNMPGASMTILPRSVRDANGQPVVTNVSFTQVNMERVPMPPPLGSQFMLAWTVQPAGLHFDPPARMCIPNMGAPAGQVVEMFSFDHDLVQFVAIGTATVTADGALMCSDPGFGVTKSGWGGCVPPPPPCTQPRNAPCPPANTPCYKYLPIPVTGPCVCPYGRFDAKITMLDAKANGKKSVAVCLEEDINFTAEIMSEYCDGHEFEWDFNDGFIFDTKSTAQNPTFRYSSSGTYTVELEAKCTGCDRTKRTSSATVKVIKVDSLKPSEGEEIDDGDGDDNTKSFVVCKKMTGTITVTAKTDPAVAEADLPTGWSLTGGTGTGKLMRTVDKTMAGTTVIQARCATSMKTVTIHVLGADLTVGTTPITLCQDNMFTAMVMPAVVPIEKYVFEIRRTSSASWYELEDTTMASITKKARVAGFFKVRVKAVFDDGFFSDSECISDEKDLEIQFPNYADIVGDATVSTATATAWANTLAATTMTTRREEGFWIRIDTSDCMYSVTATVLGPVVGPTVGGAVTLGARPADSSANPNPNSSGVAYSIGSFHTHTPTVFRPVGRPIGPSGADHAADTSDNVVGVVYDYTDSPAGSGSIPAGHPLASPATRYHSGPARRTTPP